MKGEKPYLISGKVQRPVRASAKWPRSMPFMVGLTRVASRRATNSKPSLETSVTYSLSAMLSSSLVWGRRLGEVCLLHGENSATAHLATRRRNENPDWQQPGN